MGHWRAAIRPTHPATSVPSRKAVYYETSSVQQQYVQDHGATLWQDVENQAFRIAFNKGAPGGLKPPMKYTHLCSSV